VHGMFSTSAYMADLTKREVIPRSECSLRPSVRSATRDIIVGRRLRAQAHVVHFEEQYMSQKTIIISRVVH
jgi:hypothetical protein